MSALIRVGPLAVTLDPDGADWGSVLEPRYGAFALASAPRSDFTLRLVACAGAPDASALTALYQERVVLEMEERRWSFAAATYSGTLDLDRRRGEIVAPLHRHAADFALRLLLATELAGGVLVHGALLGDADGAWLCAGPSGAGKTTLGQLFPEAALCDELAFLRRDRCGAWTAHSTPFWRGRPISAPLRAVRWICHGESDRLARLAGGEAWRRIAAEVRWPPEATARTATLERLSQLLSEVEVAELAFRPTKAVWDLLAGRAA